MIDVPDQPADVTVSFATLGLARAASRHGVTIPHEKQEPLARAALEAAWPYVDGKGPDPQP